MCVCCSLFRPGPAQHPTPKRGPFHVRPRAEPRPSSARRPRVARQLAAWPPSPLPSRPVPTRSASPSAAWPKSAPTLGNALGLGDRDARAPSRARRPSQPASPLCGAPSPFSSAPSARAQCALAVHTPAARARRQSCPQPPTLAALQPAAWSPCSGDQGIDSPPSVRRKNPRSLAICHGFVGALGFHPELPNPKSHPSFSPSPGRRGFLIALCGK